MAKKPDLNNPIMREFLILKIKKFGLAINAITTGI